MEVLKPPPRNEKQIIKDARNSGMFIKDVPSKRAAFVRHSEILQQNAEVRAMQDRKRNMQESQRTHGLFQDFGRSGCINNSAFKNFSPPNE